MKQERIVDRTSSVTLNVTAGKIDSYRKKEETTKTVRVYRDGRIGVAGALGEAELDELTSRAERALALGIPYTETADAPLVRTERHEYEAIPEGELIPTVQALLDRISAACPRFALSNKVTYLQCEREYDSTDGRKLRWSDGLWNVGLIFQNRGSGNLMDGFYEYSGRTLDADTAVEGCRRIHDAFFTPATLGDETELPVVFVFPEMLGCALRHFSGERYASGASLVSGKLGERIFSERLTLAIDRNAETSLCVPFFDDEGCVSEGDRVSLIERGVLRNVVVTKQGAARFGLPVSGTASDSAYDGVPSAGASWLSVLPTANSLAELVPGKAIYAFMVSGGDMTPDGHFAMPVQGAFLLEDGKLVGRLPELTVSGELFDLLGDGWIGAVRGDPQPDSALCAARMHIER